MPRLRKMLCTVSQAVPMHVLSSLSKAFASGAGRALLQAARAVRMLEDRIVLRMNAWLNYVF